MEKKNRLVTSNRQQQKQRILLTVLFTGMGVSAFAFLLFFITGNLAGTEKSKASPGVHGDKTVSTSSEILNEYTTLTASAAIGATQITVASNTMNANSRFSGNLEAGELIMIIQMQGATISETNSSSYGSISNYNNSGKYEFIEVAGITGSTKIDLAAGLSKAYTSTGKVQVIRVPRYQNFTVNNGTMVTSQTWNGSTGGIVAIEVNGTSTINGTIDVTGKGFRGGALEQRARFYGEHSDWRSTDDDDGAEKGESIAGYQSDYTQGRYGRGAPANGGGGGNSHNASGGGGANGNNGVSWNGKGNPDNSVANWTTAWNKESANFSTNTSSGGGRGGYSFSNDNDNPLTTGPNNITWDGDFRYNVGGYGGRPLDYSTGRIFMGGGGGAGDSNSGKGTAGASGGGIIFLICSSNVTGSGYLIANGNDATGVTGSSGWLDAPGGGGGGGTILVYSKTGSVSSLTIEAKGGKGGDWTNSFSTDEAEGAGGGGGGGYISVTNPVGLTQSVAGGFQGSNNNSIMSNFKPNGGTKGASGQIATNPPSPYTGVVALPIQLTSFSGIQEVSYINLQWITESEMNNNYFTVEKSRDGITYSQIGKVNGSGSSTSRKNYALTDKTPYQGINYYRLSQTDFNGKSSSFQPIAVELKKYGASTTADPLVFPNPYTNKFSLRINTNADKTDTRIDISDVSGKVVFSQKSILVKGSNILNFNDPGNLAPGLYMMHVKPEKEPSFTIKLIKN